MVVNIEAAMERRYSKFQPVIVDGFSLQGPTRVYLEYTEDGDFTEYDCVSGNVLETGILERPEKQFPLGVAA